VSRLSSPLLLPDLSCLTSEALLRCAIRLYDEGTTFGKCGGALLQGSEHRPICAFELARKGNVKGDAQPFEWESKLHFRMTDERLRRLLFSIHGINFGVPDWEEQAERALSQNDIYRAWVHEAGDAASVLGFVQHVVQQLAMICKPRAFRKLHSFEIPEQHFSMCEWKMFLPTQVPRVSWRLPAQISPVWT
jgi:hypothetical protein